MRSTCSRVIENRVLFRQETTRGTHLDEPPLVLDQRHRCVGGGVVGSGISRAAGPHFGDAVERWREARRYGATAVDIRVRTMYALDDIEKNSVDYYAALRSAYTQQRADMIRQKREKTDSRGELDRRDNLALVR